MYAEGFEVSGLGRTAVCAGVFSSGVGRLERYNAGDKGVYLIGSRAAIREISVLSWTSFLYVPRMLRLGNRLSLCMYLYKSIYINSEVSFNLELKVCEVHVTDYINYGLIIIKLPFIR